MISESRDISACYSRNYGSEQCEAPYPYLSDCKDFAAINGGVEQE